MNGGAEYGQPLYVHKVTPGSMAYKSGLVAGDAILQIGPVVTHGMRHDQAKMEIIRAGNEVDFIVQRNAVPVTPDAPSGQVAHHQHQQHQPQRAQGEVVEEGTPWRGAPQQNPNVQSRSFKILQQHLLEEEQNMQPMQPSG